MTAIAVNLPGREYRICLQPGILRQAAKEWRRISPRDNAFLVTSPRIRRLHGQALEESLTAAGIRYRWLEVPEGECSKCLAVAEDLYTRLIRFRADRHALMIAFGGGVIGDLAGFVAATYLRGIRLVQVPTTLLAQIDSSIGGKVGINHPLGKNLIGAFHQPRLVLTDPLVLQTLPVRELRTGLMEAVKYGVIADPRLFTFMEKSVGRLLACQPEAILRMVRDCVSIKARIVTEDERESGLRMILNFGHTLGHALEAVTDYARFKHGEAVGWGMIFAAEWACDLGLLADRERERIVCLTKAFGLPKLPRLSASDLIRAMGRDKKRSRGALRWILPDRIGHTVLFTIDDLTALKKALVRHAIAR